MTKHIFFSGSVCYLFRRENVDLRVITLNEAPPPTPLVVSCVKTGGKKGHKKGDINEGTSPKSITNMVVFRGATKLASA